MEFDVELSEVDNGVITFVVPFDGLTVYGTKAQVRVRGTIDGHSYRASMAPYDGKHYMVLRKELREQIGKGSGERIHVVMEVDDEPRVIEVPDDLQVALEGNAQVKAHFDVLSYTHRKEYVQWIEEAKKPETRARRIAKTIDMLNEGIKHP